MWFGVLRAINLVMMPWYCLSPLGIFSLSIDQVERGSGRGGCSYVAFCGRSILPLCASFSLSVDQTGGEGIGGGGVITKVDVHGPVHGRLNC